MQLIHQPSRDADFRRVEIPEKGIALKRDRSGWVVPAAVRAGKMRPSDVAHVVPFVDNELPHAALVVAPGVRDLYLGGRRPVDVYVLSERDELVVAGTRFYFTARRPLVPARHEGDASCGVCGESAQGCVAITCTHCRAVTHAGALAEGGDRQCFEHRGSCAGCGLRSEDFEWMPEGDDRD